MKTIELKTGEFQQFANSPVVELSTLKLITESLNFAPEGGFTRADFKKRSRVDAALEKTRILTASDGLTTTEQVFVDLEDQDFETIKECVSKMKWGIRSQFIEEFLDELETV